jgi:hypothetical protein
MARYEHLPIYKTAMDLTVYLEQVVRHFSRYHKYTLGSDLRQQSRALVIVIIRANSKGSDKARGRIRASVPGAGRHRRWIGEDELAWTPQTCPGMRDEAVPATR